MAPAGQQLSQEARVRVVCLLLQGIKHDRIATDVGCSVASVYYIIHNLKTYGSATKPEGEIPRGRPSKINKEAADRLEVMTNEDPNVNKGDLVRMLRAEFGIEVSRGTVARFLERVKEDRKVRLPSIAFGKYPHCHNSPALCVKYWYLEIFV